MTSRARRLITVIIYSGAGVTGCGAHLDFNGEQFN